MVSRSHRAKIKEDLEPSLGVYRSKDGHKSPVNANTLYIKLLHWPRPANASRYKRNKSNISKKHRKRANKSKIFPPLGRVQSKPTTNASFAIK